MDREWCEVKRRTARAPGSCTGRRPEEGPGWSVPAMGSQRGHGFCSRFATETYGLEPFKEVKDGCGMKLSPSGARMKSSKTGT